MTIHEKYMLEAFKLAFDQIGLTSPNPPVGAVIVKNNNIISRGATQQYGSDHAEVVAIKSASEDLSKSDMYVTLEPCCHYGKTPPCTEAIIRSGIKRVFISIKDPNPLVAGKGIEALSKAGVDVQLLSSLSDFGNQLLRPFSTYIKQNRPYIMHKAAMTIDGKISTINNDSKWISSKLSRMFVHRIRSIVDGIIVGKGTFENDNPSLDVRFEDFENENNLILEKNIISGEDNVLLKMLCDKNFKQKSNIPYRVLYGLPDYIDKNMNFFKNDKFIIFTNNIKALEDKKRKDNIIIREYYDSDKIIFIDENDRKNFVQKSMEVLAEKGLMFLMLEGGAKLASSFLNAKIIDEILYFIVPKIVGGGNSIFNGNGVSYIKDSQPAFDISTFFLNGDLVYHGYLN